MTMPSFFERIDTLAATIESFVGPVERVEVERLRARLREPLRIAIAGRVKAGKSTLLNALVGEKLAPTDAGECTRVVAWYQDGVTYGVQAVAADGTRRDIPFRRDGGPLEITVPDHDVARLEVTWPSTALRATTLIDTPGLESADDSVSVRTRDFLAVADDRPSDADAVIYLMRHLHRRDAEFLDAFVDRNLANASPVNAIAVLSRADEIGAARPDAMASARRIAERYAADPRVQELCTAVVPVAGLLAETGLTLTEREAEVLRSIAARPDPEVGVLLLSADRFVAPSVSDIAPEVRAEVIERLGLFGVRRAIGWLRDGSATTAVDLARLLVDESGLDELRAVIESHFLPRASALKARSVLVGLRALARRLAVRDAGTASRIAAETEAVESATHELAELRLAHLVASGMVRFDDVHRDEVRRVTMPGSVAERLGVEDDESADAVLAAALDGVQRWRERSEVPTLDPAGREAAQVVARSYEGLYAAAHVPTRPSDAGR